MKYFLIIFSLFLLTACGESEAEIKKRERNEKRQEMVQDAQNTLDAGEQAEQNKVEQNKVKQREIISAAEFKRRQAEKGSQQGTETQIIMDGSGTNVIVKGSDYEWDTLILEKNKLIINHIFTVKAKVQDCKIIYHLYRNNKLTGNWTNHDDWDGDTPIEDMVRALLRDYGKPRVGDKEAFKFD